MRLPRKEKKQRKKIGTYWLFQCRFITGKNITESFGVDFLKSMCKTNAQVIESLKNSKPVDERKHYDLPELLKEMKATELRKIDDKYQAEKLERGLSEAKLKALKAIDDFYYGMFNYDKE